MFPFHRSFSLVAAAAFMLLAVAPAPARAGEH
jgi:hypothetical protein